MSSNCLLCDKVGTYWLCSCYDCGKGLCRSCYKNITAEAKDNMSTNCSIEQIKSKYDIANFSLWNVSDVPKCDSCTSLKNIVWF